MIKAFSKIWIIIVALVIVAGGIFAWQYFGAQKEEGEILSTKKPIVQERITVTTDKNEYERQENVPVIFTIKNIADKKIFSTWEGASVGFNINFESYNEGKKLWEITRHFFFDFRPFLNPNESVSVDNEKLFESIPVASDVSQKLRIGVDYLDHDNCEYPTYMDNQEVRDFCYKQIKTVYSNEFIIKGPIAEASEFCSRWREGSSIDSHFISEVLAAGDSQSSIGPTLYFNFDTDEDREILGLCEKGESDKKLLLFVLDKKNNQYESILEKEGETFQRYYTFKNLRTNDVDKDGMDEIIYEENGWYGGGGDSYVHLYAPKYQQWFWLDRWWKIDIESGRRGEGTTFSPNLELGNYKIFKEFLLKQ